VAVFRYETVSAGGAPQTIEAADRATALRELTSRGVVPKRLEQVAGRQRKAAAGGATGAGKPRFGGSVMSRAEMAGLIRELATAVNAGLPIVAALKTIAGSGRTPAQRAMLETIIHDVERGRSLADSMRAVGKPFTELVTNLVQAGEVAGRLGEVLQQAGVLMERDLKLRRALISALIYPAILTTLVVVAVIILVTVIVPNILASVEGQLETLPLPTMIVQGMAAFFSDWWWLAIGGVAFAIWSFSRLYREPGPRRAIDTVLLQTPVAGRILRDVAVARFTRTFGALTGAGLPVLTSLRITKRTLGNVVLESAIEDVCDEVSHGKTIADPLEKCGYFPSLLVQIVGLGERTGKLDEVLMQAADAMEEKTEQAMDLFKQVLQPVLIVLLACVVGFVVLAVLLPLIEMQRSVAGAG